MSGSRPRFGISGLDTSHSTAWVRLLQSHGFSITIHDEGAVWSREEVDGYCRAQRLPRVDSLDELAERCDIVAVLACDWDRHIAVAGPLINAGKTVYIDKPVACTDADLDQLVEWPSRQLVLGSGNRYEPQLLAWRGEPVDNLRSSIAQSGRFYRAIHAVETGQTVIGTGARRVRWVDDPRGPTLEVEHEKLSSWIIGWERSERGFEITRAFSDKTDVLRFQPGPFLHQRLLDEILRVFRGGSPLFAANEAAEAIRILRAGWTSRQRDRTWIPCQSDELLTFSGADFSAAYRHTEKARLA